MKSSARRSCLLLASAVIVGNISLAAADTIATAHEAAKDAEYSCPAPPPAEARTRASELEAASWDKNKLACAADIWFALSNAAPADAHIAVHALQVTTAYIRQVNIVWNYDLYGVHAAEYLARIGHAAEQGKALESRVAALSGDDPNAAAVRALYKIAWSERLAETKIHLAESRSAMQLLSRTVAADPGALHGDAVTELARLYYDLPEFAGGDQDKARELLKAAIRTSPKNPALLRYAAYVDVQSRETDAAKASLSALLAVEDSATDLQGLADELKGAQELATRLADQSLERRLAAKRDALLQQHPELLHRLPTASNLHGGVDPMTGKEY
jgi:hypothetical protein